MTQKEIFSSRIKECRKLAGMSQQRFADVVGISISRLSEWEHGAAFPRANTLKRIAAACGITPAQLCADEPITQIKLTEEMQPKQPTQQEFMPSTVEQTAEPLPPFVKLPDIPAQEQPTQQLYSPALSKTIPGISRTQYRNAVRETINDLSAIIGESKATMIAVEYVVARLEIRLFDN